MTVSKYSRSKEVESLEFNSPGPKMRALSTRRGRTLNIESSSDDDDDDDGQIDSITFIPPVGSTARDRALGLLQQLCAHFYTEDDEEDDGCAGNDDNGVNLDIRSRVYHQARALQDKLSGADENNVYSLALLGRNGDGKSMLINLLVSVTCPLQEHYGVRAHRKLHCSGLQLSRQLEAVQSLQCSTQSENLPLNDIVKLLGDGDFTAEMKKDEIEKLKKIDEACLKSPDGTKVGFILPSCANVEATTPFCIRVRHGNIFHLHVSFKTEGDIRRELAAHEALLLDDDIGSESESDVPEMMELKCVKKVIKLLSGDADEDTPVSVKEFTIIDSVKKAIAYGHRIISGIGEDMLADRCFVRNGLSEIIENEAVACMVKDCVLYCPSDLLQGFELVDTPGTGTDNPFHWKQLRDALPLADGVMVVMQRSIRETQELKTDLEKCGILDKFLQDPQRCPLLIFSALEEKSAFFTAEAFTKEKVRTGEHGKNLNKAMKGSFDALYKHMKSTSTAKSAADGTKAHDDEEIKSTLQSKIISTRPLLLTSLWKCIEVNHATEERNKDAPSESWREIRRIALENLGGGALLDAIEGLHRGKAHDKLLKFADHIQATLKNSTEEKELFTDDELRNAKTASEAAWRSVAPLADNLLQQCDDHFCIQVRQKYESEFKKFIPSLKKRILEKFDKTSIITELQKQAEKLRLIRLRHAFNKMSQGKTKNFSLFNIFFKAVRCPDKKEIADQLHDLARAAEMLLRQLLVSVISSRLGNETGVQSRSRSALSTEAETRINEIVKEFLPKEIKQMLRGLLSLGKPTDKSLDRWWDEACRESLVDNCLCRAEGFKMKPQYIELLEDSVQDVMEGVAGRFCEKLQRGVEECINRLNRGLRESQGKHHTALILRLYKSGFKWILERRSISAENLQEFKNMEIIIKKFGDVCRVDADKNKRCDFRLLHLIERRYLHKSLKDVFPNVSLPIKCKSVGMVLDAGAVAAVAEEEVREALRKFSLTAVTSSESTADLSQLIRDQIGDQSELGQSSDGAGALFDALSQLALKKRQVSDDVHRAMRRLLVSVIVERYQSDEQAREFQEIWGEMLAGPVPEGQAKATVQQWAERMLNEKTPGDAVVIDAFSHHYKINILLYTPTSPTGPLTFPMRRPFGASLPSSGWLRLAYTPWIFGGGQFVPVRVRSKVAFSPVLVEEREIQVDDDEKEEKRGAIASIRHQLHESRRANNLHPEELTRTQQGLPPE